MIVWNQWLRLAQRERNRIRMKEKSELEYKCDENAPVVHVPHISQGDDALLHQIPQVLDRSARIRPHTRACATDRRQELVRGDGIGVQCKLWASYSRAMGGAATAVDAAATVETVPACPAAAAVVVVVVVRGASRRGGEGGRRV